MPLVHISLRAGKPPAYRKAVSDGVFEAMLATINVPANDKFQLVTELPADGLIYDAGYLGIRRTDDVVFIEVTLNQGRSLEMKKAFYARIAENLAKVPTRVLSPAGRVLVPNPPDFLDNRIFVHGHSPINSSGVQITGGS